MAGLVENGFHMAWHTAVMADPITSLRLPADVRAWLRQRAVDLDTTLVAVVTKAVRERMVDEPAGPTCPGCGAQRPPLLTFDDSMAHAQCAQVVADLEREAGS